MKKLCFFALAVLALSSCQTNDFHGKWENSANGFDITWEFPKNENKLYIITNGNGLHNSDVVETYTYVQTDDGEYTFNVNHVYSEYSGWDVDIDGNGKTFRIVVKGTKMTYYCDLGEGFGTTSSTFKRKL